MEQDTSVGTDFRWCWRCTKKYIFKTISGSAPIIKSVNLDFSLNFDYMTLIALAFSQFNDLNTVQNTQLNPFLYALKNTFTWQKLFLLCQAHLTYPLFHLLSKLEKFIFNKICLAVCVNSFSWVKCILFLIP